jgi:hypothetical protein
MLQIFMRTSAPFQTFARIVSQFAKNLPLSTHATAEADP